MCLTKSRVRQIGSNVDWEKKFGFAGQARYHAGFVIGRRRYSRTRVNFLDAWISRKTDGEGTPMDTNAATPLVGFTEGHGGNEGRFPIGLPGPDSRFVAYIVRPFLVPGTHTRRSGSVVFRG